MIEGKKLAEALGMSMDRIMKETAELFGRCLIGIKFGELQGNLQRDYELARFYRN